MSPCGSLSTCLTVQPQTHAGSPNKIATDLAGPFHIREGVKCKAVSPHQVNKKLQPLEPQWFCS